MKIKKLKLSNFRTYKEEVTIDLNDLNVFVGKNDIGKSTILEALDLFFNENKSNIKIDREDINKQCKNEGNNEIKISVVFDNLPDTLTIDATNPTKLKDEYLLLNDGTLEIIKKYQNAGKEKVFINAHHPTNPSCKDLLLLKNSDLKNKLDSDKIDCADRTKNAEMRKSIWDHYKDDLQLYDIEIEIAKLDAKNTWEQLKNYLPLFSLFQSDRKNSDGDNEIQNPMKYAVQEILKNENLKNSLDNVAKEVVDKLKEVSNRTLEKLKEMNPELANSLNPVIPSAESLKWADVFKNVSITGDEDIPINKRGSGVKRLILLNFFRAEAERRQIENNISDIIYAVEEPETSQHPDHQRKLINAFIELSKSDNTQIILTTHSPAIVKLLDFEHIRLIKDETNKEIINIERGNLPYPSLNEINYLAFEESDEEYHNELYGFIESEHLMNDFKTGKETMQYIRLNRDGNTIEEQKTLSEYIRHQIHHPENTNNLKFTKEQLQQSISEMRSFIQRNNS
ncbi:MAG: ATP-binding protein [Tissierellales bacterium]|nr:ATP-binding protein [Tissierellales bacterium]